MITLLFEKLHMHHIRTLTLSTLHLDRHNKLKYVLISTNIKHHAPHIEH